MHSELELAKDSRYSKETITDLIQLLGPNPVARHSDTPKSPSHQKKPSTKGCSSATQHTGSPGLESMGCNGRPAGGAKEDKAT